MAKATRWVGIDWAYRRAAWCALGAGGEIDQEGIVPADEDGLVRLVLSLGTEVKACVEMMSGAIWVRDRLAAAGWQVQIAQARKVRDIAPLACKTDKVDARVLAELCRRDLVPELWIPSLADRELRERLRRRMHLVRLRTSAKNRIFGLLTQWGLRLSLKRLREPDAIELLAERGVPPAWRDSIAEALAVIDLLDQRIAPIADERCARSPPPMPACCCWSRSPGSDRCSGSRSPARSATSHASDRPPSSSATPAWHPASSSPETARAPARSPRPAHGRCAGPPSKPPNRAGDRPTPGTPSTSTSPSATVATPRSPPSRARS
jgi:hypothetical protein